jgi:hypothetical protein
MPHFLDATAQAFLPALVRRMPCIVPRSGIARHHFPEDLRFTFDAAITKTQEEIRAIVLRDPAGEIANAYRLGKESGWEVPEPEYSGNRRALAGWEKLSRGVRLSWCASA